MPARFVLLASLWWLSERDQQPPTQAQLAAQAGTDQMMTSQVLRKSSHAGCSSVHRIPATHASAGCDSPQPGARTSRARSPTSRRSTNSISRRSADGGLVSCTRSQR
jgi:hypothetical protein